MLDALKIKGFKDKDKNNNNNLLEISNGTSAVINPETSIVNIKHELDIEDTCRFEILVYDLTIIYKNIFVYDNSFTFRCSEDVQSVFTNDDSPVSDISLPVIKKERENSFNTLQNEKKVNFVIALFL